MSHMVFTSNAWMLAEKPIKMTRLGAIKLCNDYTNGFSGLFKNPDNEVVDKTELQTNFYFILSSSILALA